MNPPFMFSWRTSLGKAQFGSRGLSPPAPEKTVDSAIALTLDCVGFEPRLSVQTVALGQPAVQGASGASRFAWSKLWLKQF